MASVQMVVMCAYCGRYVRTKECDVPDAWANQQSQVSHGYCSGCECAVMAIHETYRMSIDPHWQEAVNMVEKMFIENCKKIKGGGSVNHSHLGRSGDTTRGVDALSGSHPPSSTINADVQSPSTNLQQTPDGAVSASASGPFNGRKDEA